MIVDRRNTMRPQHMLCLCLTFFAYSDFRIENNVDVLSEDFSQSDEVYMRIISPAYINLRSFVNINSILALQKINSDEMCAPVKSNDRHEGGHWQRLHRHEWIPEDPPIVNTWNLLYQGVNECNRLLKALEEMDIFTISGFTRIDPEVRYDGIRYGPDGSIDEYQEQNFQSLAGGFESLYTSPLVRSWFSGLGINF